MIRAQQMKRGSYTVEVMAATLYEAVAQGLAAIRGNGLVAGIAEGPNPMFGLQDTVELRGNDSKISQEKLKGLRMFYGADERTCRYFDVHMSADALHAQVWREQLQQCLERNSRAGHEALQAAGTAGGVLWRALDSIESDRLKRAAANRN